MKVAYFVHDLHDAAVIRRVAMIQAGGLDPVILGFRRTADVPEHIIGATVVDLGRTADARLAQRATAILRNLLLTSKIRHAVEDCSIFVGRNLESLILASRAARGRPGARLVYECLDIHRTLLGDRTSDRLIQSIESRYLRRTDLLITSSPAFLDEYFARRSEAPRSTLLLENKVLRIGSPPTDPPSERDEGPPWTIGWFGMLRCQKSLNMLRSLVRRSHGRIKVLIAGKPAYSTFVDFESAVRGIDGLEFVGAYKSEDLRNLYRRTHFTWTIDYYEEGLNSAWLLPNRLYEGSFHGSVPIALGSVETGAWLRRHDAGILVDDPVADLSTWLESLDEAGYRNERERLARIPRSDLVTGQADCDALRAAIEGRA